MDETHLACQRDFWDVIHLFDTRRGHWSYSFVLKFIIQTTKKQTCCARWLTWTHFRSVIFLLLPVCMTVSGILKLGVAPAGLESPRIDRQRLPRDWLIGCLCHWATEHLAGECMSRTGGRTKKKKNRTWANRRLSTHARGYILNIAD